MAKRGRKSGFNEKVQQTILRLIQENKTEDQIAEIIGVSRTTISNWKGKHPDLLYAIRESKLDADELVKASLFSRAVGYSHTETKTFMYEGCVVTEDIIKRYPPDTQAAMFWLRNRQPKEWREKNESDVNVNTTNNLSTLTEEQLDARIAKYLANPKKETAE